MIRMSGEPMPNMPWEDRPAGCADVVWRHSRNPITDWNPTPKTARIFNSSVVPWRDGFAGIFRADHKHGMALLHVGFSKDGLAWTFADEEIHWKDAQGRAYDPVYAYDPRLVKLDDAYYIIWCTDFGGPALGFGMTTDFELFTRLENITIPFNRNGVLFPRKIRDKYELISRPSDSCHTPFGDIFLSESPVLVHRLCLQFRRRAAGS